jgi:hypothetical protein
MSKVKEAFLRALFDREADVSVHMEKDGRMLSVDVDETGVYAFRDDEDHGDELKTAEDVYDQMAWLDGVN